MWLLRLDANTGLYVIMHLHTYINIKRHELKIVVDSSQNSPWLEGIDLIVTRPTHPDRKLSTPSQKAICFVLSPARYRSIKVAVRTLKTESLKRRPSRGTRRDWRKCGRKRTTATASLNKRSRVNCPPSDRRKRCQNRVRATESKSVKGEVDCWACRRCVLCAHNYIWCNVILWALYTQYIAT